MLSGIDADTLRTKYIEFFRQRAHAVIPSESLIPDNDPSVLFTTAGMHPLIPYLMGRPHPAGKRLVDVQKCIRTNDIEEVGDSTHLTFFEMLGNWSLGDYFKEESITWSYTFLTGQDWLNLPPERIWISVFAGDEIAPRDEESAAVWRSLGIPAERIVFLSAEHNWWAVGDEGPCGPDTEIFIDTTGRACERGAACSLGSCECGRFVEIWNNVFMAYNRTAEGVSSLPAQNVDTGMGLERTLAILNGVPTVYETSSFRPITDALLRASGRTDGEVAADPKLTRALRVVSDHLRSAVFVLGDAKAVTPSNQGQGYVLRRIIRRAIRFCETLGLAPAQWVDAAQVIIDAYGHAYPELLSNSKRIHEELTRERERFEKTLGKGTQLLDQEIDRIQADGRTMIPGEIAFRLYDTYGFPVEFTQELAAERGLTVDMEDYVARFDEHRLKSKSEVAKSGLADHSGNAIRYHTATHLLHAALRSVLGPHVQQKGSNITAERMRFDFSHPQAMTKEQIAAAEQFIQNAIDQAIPVTMEMMPYPKAVEGGAIGLFEDRYGNDVSVYSMGNVSKEICAGPHVQNTSEIGRFKIEKEQSASSGVRRIRATIS